MALVRLVRPEDYVPLGPQAPGLYVVPWEERVGPGNPTDSPETGADLFNAWQLQEARGEQGASDPSRDLSKIVGWCLDHPNERPAQLLAADIVSLSGKADAASVNLSFNDQDYPGQAFHFRQQLPFLRDQVKDLPAGTLFKLRCLIR